MSGEGNSVRSGGATPVNAPARHSGGSVRDVLVVDDSRLQRYILSVTLGRWGYRVHEAESGDAALDLCRTVNVDLVLSDWMMPGMSGLDLCRAFRALPRENYGYFILLTSKSDKATLAQGLEEGADDFLAKPVNSEELRARIIAGERILKMQGELKEKNRLVTDTLAKLQEIHDFLDRDLVQARQLQQSLLRDRYRDFGNAQVSIHLRPSGHVGGDLVGFFQLDPQRVGLFAIDVSGHGVSSALMTARLAGLFSGRAPEQNIALRQTESGGIAVRPPSEVVSQINRIMLDDMETDHYCTVAYGEADLASGKVRVVQAGHPHPVLQRATGEVAFLGTGGLPVGLLDLAVYTEFDVTLQPGERLLLVSDGVTECVDPAGEELCQSGLEKIMRRLGTVRGADFHEALVRELSHHSQGSEFRDDVSTVLFEYDGPMQI